MVSEEENAKGTIESIEWSGSVSGYDNARSGVRYKQQILLSKPVEPGDSGSLLLNEDKATGLVFASSHMKGLASPIDKVLEALKADIASAHTMTLHSHNKQ